MTSDQLCAEAMQRHLAGDPAGAEALYRAALARDPRHADSLHQLGRLAHAQGQAEAAVGLIEQAVQLKPRSAAYREGLGLALRLAGRGGEAVAAFRHAVRLDKSSFGAHYNLGNALAAIGEHFEAARLFRRAAALNPGFAGTYNNLGHALRETGDEAGAGAAFARALALAPDDALLHVSHGNWLREHGDLAGAERCFRTGLSLAPEEPLLNYGLAITLLNMGRFREGLAAYEWRWPVIGATPPVSAPRWAGESDSAQTLLITAEQGQGDVIQFLRYVPLAARRLRVVLEVYPLLRRLAATLPGPAALVTRGEVPPRHDFVCPIMSLPRILGLDDAPLGTEQPYLHPDPADAAQWAKRLAAVPGCKIGLVWAGAASYATDRRRSVPPHLFDILARDDVSFISLQKDPVARPALALADWTRELLDFADTAALISQLDLVIAVDTGVAHLAGALGKPVWLLNRYDSDWRWGREGETTLWYPRMRQFRQKKLGDWGPVVEAIRVALGNGLRPGV
jgi:tetratricopeptide (TPR) repeat protein